MKTVLESLNAALYQALSVDKRVLLLGEDILAPYGGAFKVTRGLSTDFPERVLATPISEAGFIGLATGMAMRGLRPVAEIMFGDFLTLAADQLINHTAKFRWMYNGGKTPEEMVRVPLVVRTPMGGRRGYGPTHSQTLEKHFLGAPGLRVLAPNALSDPGELLLQAVLHTEEPVLFIENKLLYLLPVTGQDHNREFEIDHLDFDPPDRTPAPTTRVTIRGGPPPKITIAAYGYMAELVCQAMLELAYEHEIFIELVAPTQLAPFEITPVLESVKRTGRLLAVEEGNRSLGWGAEIIAEATEKLGPHMKTARRLAARDLPIPASGVLEAAILPDSQDILAIALEMAQTK